jgi:V/A-type H+-transporting ATPase subunit I
MAVARLSLATLRSSRAEVGILLARLMEFGEFHPDRRDDMIQDTELLMMESRAHAIYSEASELLEKDLRKVAGQHEEKAETLKAHAIEDLLKLLGDYLETINEFLSEFRTDKEVAGIRNLVTAVKECSLAVFNNLSRIMVIVPAETGFVRLRGFIPTRSSESFKLLIEGYLVSLEPVERRGKQDPYVPSLLVNPRVISVFQSLTLERGIPKYNEIDPTPIVALVFPFFFGIMFGDLGHGAIIAVAGVYLGRKTKYKAWGQLLPILGMSSAVVGLLRGEFFGLEFTSPLGTVIHFPQALSGAFTLRSIPLLLEVAIVIGTFHLGTAYVLSFLDKIESGEFFDAFTNRLPTLLLYVSLILFVLAVAGTNLQSNSIFTSNAPTPFFQDLLGLTIQVSLVSRLSAVLIIGSLLTLVVGPPADRFSRTHSLRKTARSLGAGVLEAGLKPLEFFINTLSYVRLGVLLITTTLLASLVAGMLALGFVGLLLAIFLNVMIIALEGVIVYVQDMRLHLYEWFSQFYSGTGIPFTPLASNGIHFRLVWLRD